MPQDPSRPNERHDLVRAVDRNRLLAFVAAIALLALTGCAAVPTQPPHSSSASADSSVDRPESAAEPSAPRSADATPPDSSAVPTPVAPTPRVMIVKASAYNSRPGQTDATPSVGAWGDRLTPGMRVIAVSKDLLELGLRRGQRVRIAGLPGEFVVLDRMPSRWQQKIDIYMGHDVRAARAWGVRHVEISWIPRHEPATDSSSAIAGDSDTRPDPDVVSGAD